MGIQRARPAAAFAKVDWLLVVAVVALLNIGLMMVYSSTTFHGVNFRLDEDPNKYFVSQIMWLAVGTGVLVFLARVDYHRWRRYSILIMAVVLALLGLVLILGQTKFGAQRWLLGGSVQPSELAKIAVVIYIADWLASKGDRIRNVTVGLIPFAVLVGFVAGLIVLQQHLSSAVLITATALAMFFIAGGQIWQLLLSGVLGSVPLVYLIIAADYRVDRITAFLSPLNFDTNDNYQTIQSLIALASGGLLPLGPGESRQKFGYIPFAHTDNIFAVLGEELGLIGCLVVLGLFAFLAYRGFRVAMNAPDMFGVLLASGVTCTLIIQALVNVAVVTATAPATGIPLPFISYGGSSLVISLAGIGLLLSVSRGAPAPGTASGAEEGTLTSETHDLRRWNRRPRLSRTHRRKVADLWD
jgi:cell division protein FtsW